MKQQSSASKSRVSVKGQLWVQRSSMCSESPIKVLGTPNKSTKKVKARIRPKRSHTSLPNGSENNNNSFCSSNNGEFDNLSSDNSNNFDDEDSMRQSLKTPLEPIHEADEDISPNIIKNKPRLYILEENKLLNLIQAAESDDSN